MVVYHERLRGRLVTVSGAITIGTTRGVDIKVHPSFALVILWVIYQWGIAADAGLRGMVFGSFVLLAVFACVLAHELAHAVVAMRHGLVVHDITLLPIGGVARVEYAALSPRSEALIAVAGPAMNVAIAFGLVPVVLLVAAARHLDHPFAIVLYADELSIAGFILYLWITNILLALFNLLPAFPMDGGRILRAALTNVTDRLTATQAAVAVGQVFAAVLALVGLWLGDYLLPLIALFILVAAQMEARWVRIETALKKLPVGQFALWESGGVRPDVPLAQAIRGGPHDIAVTQHGAVVGMLWRQDLLRHLNGAHHQILVKDVMDLRATTVDAGDSVYDVHLWLAAAGRPAVPVVEGGQYRGIFTTERLAHIYEHIDHRTHRWQRDALALIRRLREVTGVR
jgi:Zn-dependent protease